MSVFKPMYKDGKGRSKKVKRRYIEFKDHQDTWRRIPAYELKEISTEVEGKIKKLVRNKKTQRPDLIHEASKYFFEEMPEMKDSFRIRSHLIKLGLLDEKKTEAGVTSLVDFVGKFCEYMKMSPNIKDKTYKQARQTANRVRKIIKDCGFKTWSDVNTDRVQMCLSKLGVAPRTLKFYTKAFERFAGWMVNQGYAADDTASKLEKVKVPKRPERAFEPEEFTALLKAAAGGPERYGLTGYQRRLLYLLAVETGLRRGELRSLTPASFRFKHRTVFVGGVSTKNSNHAEQDMSPELALQMQEYCRGKMPNVQLFPLPDHTAEMLQEDCEAGGIVVNNIRGKLKFHSLRHTCASLLIAQGANPKVVQEIMRHSSIELTMGLYGHLFTGQKKSAIAGLGKFSVHHAATGTE